MIPDRKLCFFIFERFGHVFRRKSFVESLVRSVHVLVKTRLSRFFLGNLKETERCFLGLACYLPLGGAGGSPRRCIVLVVNGYGLDERRPVVVQCNVVDTLLCSDLLDGLLQCVRRIVPVR